MLWKKKKLFILTVMAIALVQMPSLALSPAIQQIQSNVFPDRTLAQVQTAMALTSFISPCFAVVSALLVNKRILSKRNVIVLGLCVLALTGVLAILLHTEFWHLIMLSVTLGIATGLFLSNAFGLVFDLFEDNEREAVAGYQTSCVNIGGILMSVVGGQLATMIWFGGYLVLIIGLPIAALVFFAIPNRKAPPRPAAQKGVFAGLQPRVFYYSFCVMFFLMIYSVCGNNISTRLDQLAIGNSATAGIATAIQMLGGVVSGIFFGRISQKLRDWTQVVACLCVFVGYLLLSFAKTLPVVYISVFIVGLALSLMMPRCIFCVSTLVNESTSATATAIVSSICPSLGGFLTPIVFTNLTVALFGDSTALRYRFVAFVVLAFAAVLAVVAIVQKKRGTEISA